MNILRKIIREILEEEDYTVYHGSPKEFDAFSLDFVGDGLDQHGPGFYFTSSYDNAFMYGNVKKYIVTIDKEPKLKGGINREEIKKLMKWAPDLEDSLTNWAENPKIAFDKAFNAMINTDSQYNAFLNVWYDFYRNNTKQYLINISKLGYDGIILNQNQGIKYYIMFNPNKIKKVS